MDLYYDVYTVIVHLFAKAESSSLFRLPRP